MIKHLPRSQITAALAALASLDVKITEILYFLLSFSPQDNDFKILNALNDLSDPNKYPILLDLFKLHPAFASGTHVWIQRCTTGHLIGEVKELSKKSSSWHGDASVSTVEQFAEINFTDLALVAKDIAPALWELFDQLFRITDSDSDHGDDSIIDIDDDANNAMDLDDNDMQNDDTSTDREFRIRELVSTPMILLK